MEIVPKGIDKQRIGIEHPVPPVQNIARRYKYPGLPPLNIAVSNGERVYTIVTVEKDLSPIVGPVGPDNIIGCRHIRPTTHIEPSSPRRRG